MKKIKIFRYSKNKKSKEHKYIIKMICKKNKINYQSTKNQIYIDFNIYFKKIINLIKNIVKNTILNEKMEIFDNRKITKQRA